MPTLQTQLQDPTSPSEGTFKYAPCHQKKFPLAKQTTIQNSATTALPKASHTSPTCKGQYNVTKSATPAKLAPSAGAPPRSVQRDKRWPKTAAKILPTSPKGERRQKHVGALVGRKTTVVVVYPGQPTKRKNGKEKNRNRQRVMTIIFMEGAPTDTDT